MAMPTIPPRPAVYFVAGCERCGRNKPLAEVRAGGGLCGPCRAVADATAARLEATRLDALGMKLAAGFAAFAVVVLIGVHWIFA